MDKELKISVASPTHLYVSWKTAFKDCEDGNIVATNVIIGNRPLAQIPGSKEAHVQSNPCIRHSIRVELYVRHSSGSPETVWSHTSYYNADSKIENVYSGLLNRKFKEEICAISDKNSSSLLIDQIPEIPDQIKKCVFKGLIRKNGPHGFKVPIIKLDGEHVPGEAF